MEDNGVFNKIEVLDELETSLPARRTNFLSVLCILTWVGSAASMLPMIVVFMLSQPGLSRIGENSMNFWFVLQVLLRSSVQQGPFSCDV